MMRVFILAGLLLILNQANGQIISQFSWDNNPITQADIGPDAISVSSSCISSIGGVNGTNGLNAGLPKADIVFTLQDNPIFDVDGIDISFDYQRDESVGVFFKRGNNLIINGCANLSVTFKVSNGTGSAVSVSSGNVYSIPDDDVFRNYRFYYLPATGYAAILVDGNLVWSHDGPDNRDFYWSGAGNIIIGSGMDGSGRNDVFFDNFTIAEVYDTPLPIELSHFSATHLKNNAAELKWTTLTEINNDYFVVQKLEKGSDWEEVAHIQGQGSTNEIQHYYWIDNDLNEGISYYRLKQVDFDGSYTYSNVSIINHIQEGNITLYPNPASDFLKFNSEILDPQNLRIFNVQGRDMTSLINLTGGTSRINIKALPKGAYILVHHQRKYRFVKK